MTPSFGGDATNAGSLNWGKKASSEADEELLHGTARALIHRNTRTITRMPTASVDSNDSTAGSVQAMATLTIRNLDNAVRDRLRRRAAEHGHSMEEEVRQILRQVVEPTKPAATKEGLGSRIHNHFARLGGLELELPARNDTPTAARFEP